MTAEKPTKRKSKKGYNRVLKIVRRIHMYTGLVLLPWVILFGFSGMLFNHPEWMGPVEVISKKNAGEMKQLAGFEKPDADLIADSLIEQLNGSADLSSLKWEKSSGALIEGTLGFSGTTDQGRTMVQISPNRGSANVRYVKESTPQEKPDFDGKKVSVSTFDPENTAEAAHRVVEDAGLKPKGEFEASTRGGAEVRFKARSPEDGRLWNVTYSLMGETVSARAADGPSGLGFYSTVTKLHKTHHYPDRKGARWVWTVIADATGITMVFWGISGLIMWWQIKPTRVLGIGGLGIAVVVAALIFTETFKTMTFGPTQSKGGSGKSPAQQKGRPPEGGRERMKIEEAPLSDSSIKTGPAADSRMKNL